MDNNQNSTARLHPLVATAAVSLIVLSAAGVAAITGFLPKSGASAPAHSVIAPSAAATAAAPGGITLPVLTPEAPASKPAPKPAVKKPAKPVVQARAPEEFRPAPAPQAAAQPAPAALPQPVAQAACLDCGEIVAVNAIEQKGEGSWIGPVAGGVGGAILGKQVGKGSGNTIMTILGAAGGAWAGHKIEQKVRTTTRWEVVVRMEDGGTRTVSTAEQPLWRVGDRVRVTNGTLEPQQRI